MSEELNKRIEQLKESISVAQNILSKAMETIVKIEQDERREVLKSLPGVEGVFDGFYMTSDDGKKIEVPANYAAKSRLVYGDKLKMLEEDGKTVFKQILKVPRKKLEAVLTKKEGKWYALCDNATYKISDIAAEFNEAALNDKATIIIPEGTLNAPYAALDVLEKPKNIVESALSADSERKPKRVSKPKVTKASGSAAEGSGSASSAADTASSTGKSSSTTEIPADSQNTKNNDTSKEVVSDINKEFVVDIVNPSETAKSGNSASLQQKAPVASEGSKAPVGSDQTSKPAEAKTFLGDDDLR